MKAGGRLADAPAADREVRRDFGERGENEGAVQDFRVGQLEPRRVAREVAISDDVDIDDARAPSLPGRAAELDLERLDPIEQRLRREAGPGQRAGVDEPVLVGLAPGRGAVEARD